MYVCPMYESGESGESGESSESSKFSESSKSSASVGQFLSYFVTNERSDGQGDWIRVPSKSACHWTVKTYGVTSFSEYILSEY